MTILQKYKVHPDLTEDILIKNKFENGKFEDFIYNDTLKIVIPINIDKGWWSYCITEATSDTLYSPYYLREFGSNTVVDEIDDNVIKILNKMVEVKVLSSI